jgi:ferritin-like metal-binding protein YciE
MAKLKSFEDLFVNELKDLYSAETQILKALPRMARTASSPQLQQAFEEHLQQTQHQVERLDMIFSKMGTKPTGKKCKAMEGLIDEAAELMSMDSADPDVLDAGLIVAAQKVEHYEIAGYGSVRTFAHMLGDKQAEELLQQTLDEEAETDKKLTELALSWVNPEAERENNNGSASARM